MERFASIAIAAMCVFASTPAFAQIHKGKNEAYAGISLSTARNNGNGADRITVVDWRTDYERFVTARLAVGPELFISKRTGTDVDVLLGGVIAYHFGNLDGRVIPFAELNGGFGFGSDSSAKSDVRVIGGIKIPLGRSGARLKVGPYYYRASYDRDKVGYDSFKSFGITWNVGLLWP